VSSFDDAASSSLKDDTDGGCVLLCNLSEPEVEDASLADCDEPCLVADSEQTDLAHVQCSTETSSVDCESTPARTLPQTPVSPAVQAKPVYRKKRSASLVVGNAASQKKQKRL